VLSPFSIILEKVQKEGIKIAPNRRLTDLVQLFAIILHQNSKILFWCINQPQKLHQIN
jgi:hypothetical protein